jgi:hypothetical protein
MLRESEDGDGYEAPYCLSLSLMRSLALYHRRLDHDGFCTSRPIHSSRLSINVRFRLVWLPNADSLNISTKWLNERERYIAQSRLLKDVGLIDNPDEQEKSTSGILDGVKLAITDEKVWTMALVFVLVKCCRC